MQIWSDSCLYSVSGLYSEPVYRCTMTHFPATLASPSPELAASRQQAVVPRPARRLSWPQSWARAGPRLGKFGEFGHLLLPASGRPLPCLPATRKHGSGYRNSCGYLGK